MKTVYSESNRLHFPQAELYGGELVTPFERPSRVEYILRQLKAAGFPDPVAPGDCDMAAVRTVHSEDYLAFLASAWDEWSQAGYKGEIIAASFPARRMRQRVPDHIDGKVGYYALAAETAITSGTWPAVLSACASAQTAQRWVAGGERAAFAICRPPGHHAARDLYGGYCFINNAAVVAQQFIDKGAGRVASLDIDFHHGNGIQDIFYERGDVLYCSLHGQPQDAFPYFTGYADELGAGAGEGANFNYPLPPGTAYSQWSAALDDGLQRIAAFGAEALVVSLGVDTFEHDPISFFKLRSADYLDCGRRIAGAQLPTVFVLEGGYAIDAVGINVVNVLLGFEDA
jgi:acetoin utilization deacetylase AcuC-like enzyme